MKNTTITRKSLLFSGFALLLSALLLAGTTFAWFTDTVTNEGNTIQSGELKMDLYWFKWNAEKSQFVQVGMNQWPNAGKMSADNWEPGQSDALLVRVDNMGSLAAKVQLSFDVTNDSGLSKALWFKVTSGTGKSYSEMINTKPTEGPVYSTDTNVICMSELKKWKDDLDVVLEGHNEGTPETEWRNWYLIEYGMYADAGIEYMNGSLTTDIHFNATQAPYEEDGFGSDQYDKDAEIAWSGETDESGLKANTNEQEKTVSIDTPEQLAAFAVAVNAGNSYKGYTVTLQDNMNLDGKEWTPIGKSGKAFEGIFDGNGNMVSNLKISTPSVSDVGFFGYTSGGEVRNLKVKNAQVEGYMDVGVVAGCPYTSKYTNIEVTGTVQVKGFSYVGGMFGKNAYNDLSNLTIDVSGDS